MRRLLLLVLFAAALWVCLEFPARNAVAVDVDYLFGVFPEVPLWLALLASFGLGAGLAALVGSYRLVRLGLVSRRYRKTARGLEAEIHQLRSLPLSGAEPVGDAVAPEPLEVTGRRSAERGA